MRNIFAKYRAFRSKSSSQKYGENHRLLRIFDSFWTTRRRGNYTTSQRGNYTHTTVVRKLRNLAKYCESLSFSQGFCKVFVKFILRVSIAKHTYFRSFSHVFAVHVLSRPCFFSSCAKVFEFLWKASETIRSIISLCLNPPCISYYICDYCEIVMIAKY